MPGIGSQDTESAFDRSGQRRYAASIGAGAGERTECGSPNATGRHQPAAFFYEGAALLRVHSPRQPVADGTKGEVALESLKRVCLLYTCNRTEGKRDWAAGG
jgi:hypothetical protein